MFLTDDSDDDTERIFSLQEIRKQSLAALQILQECIARSGKLNTETHRALETISSCVRRTINSNPRQADDS